MSRYVNHISTEKNIVICFDDKTISYPRSHEHFEVVKEKLAKLDFTGLDFAEEFDKKMKVSSLPQGVTIKKGVVRVDGKMLFEGLNQKLVEFYKAGLPLYPLINFQRNLQKNPSQESKKDLFLFLMKNKIPITEKGMFRAYKYVRSDFKDCYSGQYDNSVGQELYMPWAEVDPNRNHTCSKGLHVASWEYMGMANDTAILIEVQVNPKDVVTVPTDYNAQKMRVCRYRVVRVVKQANPALLEKDYENSEQVLWNNGENAHEGSDFDD